MKVLGEVLAKGIERDQSASSSKYVTTAFLVVLVISINYVLYSIQPAGMEESYISKNLGSIYHSNLTE